MTLLLASHGTALEPALAFSLSFGFVFLAAPLLGAFVFIRYPLLSLERTS